MEKRKWLWKRKPSERSPGETESSESISSPSERFSDDQDGVKTLPNDNTQSPEVTSKTIVSSDKMDESVKMLREKLSAALVNLSAKEDLVNQHSKVAEEAVAGWEKAENEVALLKQQLQAVMQKNSTLEDRANHLDGALKECVRQLRQGRDEQEQKVNEAILSKTREWESTKADLEAQIDFLESENSALKEKKMESRAYFEPNLSQKLEFLERENKSLEHKLLGLYEELEIMTIERDLSVQAAENASKQHLEGIKKVAKLESECRKLTVLNRKSSFFSESLTDSHSDSGERSTLITELDQMKSEKSLRVSINSSPLGMDIMDDFLEMERLAAMPKSENKEKEKCLDVNRADFDAMNRRVVELEGKLKTVEAEKIELEKVLEENQIKSDFEAMSYRVVELEERLKTVEAERNELEKALAKSRSSCEEIQLKDDRNLELEAKKVELEEALVSSRSAYVESQFQLKSSEMKLEALQKELETIEAEKVELEKAAASSKSAYEDSQFQLKKAEMKLEMLQKELDGVKESKGKLEAYLSGIEAEAQTKSSQIDLLKEEILKEKSFSEEIAVKCRELEDELVRKSQEIELQQADVANGKAKIEQEELDAAAGKLAECQKTIASLGRQLQSLATIEDFLIDTANLPGFSGDKEFWKLHTDQTKLPLENSVGPLVNVDEKSPPSSSSSSSSSKGLNGYGKLFTRTKSCVQLVKKQQS